MKPTLAQLEAFHGIVQLGSVNAAAERLHLSPSTISVRIRVLERCLDRKLFERRGRQLVLTPAGTALASDADQMIRLVARISSTADPQHVRLRLGAFEGFAMVCLPQLLQLVERDYPELTFDITVDNSLFLYRKLTERSLDFTFLGLSEVGDQVRSEILGRQEAAWVASQRLGLGRRTVRPQDLADQQIFTDTHPSGLNAMVRDWFRTAGLEPSRISTCNSLTVILQLTVLGAGVSLLPMAIMRSKLRSNALERLAARPSIPPQPVFAAHHADLAGLDVGRFLAMARSVAARTRFLVT